MSLLLTHDLPLPKKESKRNTNFCDILCLAAVFNYLSLSFVTSAHFLLFSLSLYFSLSVVVYCFYQMTHLESTIAVIRYTLHACQPTKHTYNRHVVYQSNVLCWFFISISPFLFR